MKHLINTMGNGFKPIINLIADVRAPWHHVAFVTPDNKIVKIVYVSETIRPARINAEEVLSVTIDPSRMGELAKSMGVCPGKRTKNIMTIMVQVKVFMKGK